MLQQSPWGDHRVPVSLELKLWANDANDAQTLATPQNPGRDRLDHISVLLPYLLVPVAQMGEWNLHRLQSDICRARH
jgi:hypothetical protein